MLVHRFTCCLVLFFSHLRIRFAIECSRYVIHSERKTNFSRGRSGNAVFIYSTLASRASHSVCTHQFSKEWGILCLIFFVCSTSCRRTLSLALGLATNTHKVLLFYILYSIPSCKLNDSGIDEGEDAESHFIWGYKSHSPLNRNYNFDDINSVGSMNA